MYQDWPHDLEILNQDRFPLPKGVYELMAEKFSLPLEYPYILSKNKQTPLQIRHDSGPDDNRISVSSKDELKSKPLADDSQR